MGKPNNDEKQRIRIRSESRNVTSLCEDDLQSRANAIEAFLIRTQQTQVTTTLNNSNAELFTRLTLNAMQVLGLPSLAIIEGL